MCYFTGPQQLLPPTRGVSLVRKAKRLPDPEGPPAPLEGLALERHKCRKDCSLWWEDHLGGKIRPHGSHRLLLPRRSTTTASPHPFSPSEPEGNWLRPPVSQAAVARGPGHPRSLSSHPVYQTPVWSWAVLLLCTQLINLPVKPRAGYEYHCQFQAGAGSSCIKNDANSSFPWLHSPLLTSHPNPQGQCILAFSSHRNVHTHSEPLTDPPSPPKHHPDLRAPEHGSRPRRDAGSPLHLWEEERYCTFRTATERHPTQENHSASMFFKITYTSSSPSSCLI